MPSPLEGDVDDLAGPLNGIKGLECLGEDRPLLGGIERLAKRMPEWPSKEDGSRRLHLLRVFPDNRYAYGGNA